VDMTRRFGEALEAEAPSVAVGVFFDWITDRRGLLCLVWSSIPPRMKLSDNTLS